MRDAQQQRTSDKLRARECVKSSVVMGEGMACERTEPSARPCGHLAGLQQRSEERRSAQTRVGPNSPEVKGGLSLAFK